MIDELNNGQGIDSSSLDNVAPFLAAANVSEAESEGAIAGELLPGDGDLDEETLSLLANDWLAISPFGTDFDNL